MHTYGHTHTHPIRYPPNTITETGHSPARAHQLFDVTTEKYLNVKWPQWRSLWGVAAHKLRPQTAVVFSALPALCPSPLLPFPPLFQSSNPTPLPSSLPSPPSLSSPSPLPLLSSSLPLPTPQTIEECLNKVIWPSKLSLVLSPDPTSSWRKTVWWTKSNFLG